MLTIDTLRLFVDQRLTSATDDIFRLFARTISEYEDEVSQAKREIDRQRRLLEAAGRPGDTLGEAPGDTLGNTPAGVLQNSNTEEKQVRGRSLHLHIKQEEGGAPGTEDTDNRLTLFSYWLRDKPDGDLTVLSNQIQSCSEGARPSSNQELLSVKQEVEDAHMMPDGAVRVEIRCQQEPWRTQNFISANSLQTSLKPAGVGQIFTTKEEQQVRGRGLSLENLHIIHEEGGTSGPAENDSKLTSDPDWQMTSKNNEGGCSLYEMQSHEEQDLLPAPSESEGTCRPTNPYNGDFFQSESSTDDSEDMEGAEDQWTAARPKPDLLGSLGSLRSLGTGPPIDRKLLVCHSCGRGFSSKRTLTKHIRRNMTQNQDQMSCSRHRQRAPFESVAKSYFCRICGGSFYTQGILVRHAENHCKEPESRCGACGDHLDSTETLRDHLRSHKEQGCTCDVCGKKCGSIKRMEIHKRVHTGEKPYRCGFCSRDFSRKESLDRHLKVHSGDRPHRCHLCRRTFTRRDYLVQHLKTLHYERLGPSGEAEEKQYINVTL